MKRDKGQRGTGIYVDMDDVFHAWSMQYIWHLMNAGVARVVFVKACSISACVVRDKGERFPTLLHRLWAHTADKLGPQQQALIKGVTRSGFWDGSLKRRGPSCCPGEEGGRKQCLP